MVSVIIALNAGARRLRSLLNYRLCSANNVPLSTLPLLQPSSYTPFYLFPSSSASTAVPPVLLLPFSPPRPPPPFPISSLLALGERDWVLSDGPQAELRPALFLFIPLSQARSFNRAFSHPRRQLSSRNSVTPLSLPLSLSFSQIAQGIFSDGSGSRTMAGDEKSRSMNPG